jgi:hypothetical protein
VEEFIEEITECPPAEEVPVKKNKLNTYSNWDEALEDW